MVQLRKVIGDVLRARRLAQHRTLREVSTAANVSLGYLSEIERGHKEASSELLAAICDALRAPLSELLSEVAATFALAEQVEAIGTAAATSTEQAAQAADQTSVRVTDGDVTVQVRSDGPLRTTLTATRTPGPRSAETVFVG
jgi:XRE family transcriptional regulator, stress-response regulator